MSTSEQPTIIKKYANRRLYNTGTSTYVTLEDLATMVKDDENFVVQDAKSGEDITHAVLTQIIVEQEAKGENLLPVNFLRQLIQFYGDSVQSIVPSYLEQSMSAFNAQQHTFREQMEKSFGANPAMEAMKEQTRRNAEMFQQAMGMFMPFGGAQNDTSSANDERPSSKAETSAQDSGEMAAMKKQLADMQATLEAIAKKK